MCGTFLQIMLQAMMMSSWKCSRRDVFKVGCITIDLFLVFKVKFTIDVYNPLFVLSLPHLQNPLVQLQTWGPLNTKAHLNLSALAVLQSQTMLCTFFHLFAQPDLALHLLARPLHLPSLQCPTLHAHVTLASILPTFLLKAGPGIS